MSKAIKRSSGFTLIEMLVVIVIIGIVMTFALLATGDFGASRRARSQLEQLQSKLLYAQQQAVLMHAVIGARIDADHYQFLRFNADQWQLMNTPTPLTRTQIHDATLRMATTWVDPNPLNPQIIFTDNADTTAFEIELRDREQHPQWKLVGTADGKMQIEPITTS